MFVVEHMKKSQMTESSASEPAAVPENNFYLMETASYALNIQELLGPKPTAKRQLAMIQERL